jgi:hypothetical protein
MEFERYLKTAPGRCVCVNQRPRLHQHQGDPEIFHIIFLRIGCHLIPSRACIFF